MAFTSVTVNLNHKDPDGNVVDVGKVTFQPTVNMTNGDTMVSRRPVDGEIENGTGFVTLFANDDEGTTPQNSGYVVTVTTDGAKQYSFTVVIPSASTTVNLSDLAPAVGSPLYSYATTGQLAGKASVSDFSDPASAVRLDLDAVYAKLAALAGKASLPNAAETTIYVSAFGNDSNNGLTPGDAKATIAAALTAIGGTGTNTNPGRIVIGAGTWTLTATVTIAGVTGFVIEGAGQGLTKIVGPDGAPAFKGVNCTGMRVQDLTYVGSPSGTGWGVEYTANYSYPTFVGGVTPTNCKVVRAAFGGPTSSAAYGIRWSLNSGDWHHDANNDQGLAEDCTFQNVVQPIAIEHSNSVAHRIINPRFIACGGGVQFFGGSASVVNPIVAGSAGTGWFLDLQAPQGTSSPTGQTQAVYRHKITVSGFQGEQGTMGWVRSDPNSGADVAGVNTTVDVSFIGGDMRIGGVAGTPSTIVDWQANVTSGVPSRLSFHGIGGFPGGNQLIINSPSTTSELRFVDCVLYGATYTFGGVLSFTDCHGHTANTFTPSGSASHSERGCTGVGFSGATIPSSGVNPAQMGLRSWSFPGMYATANMSGAIGSGVLLFSRQRLEVDGPISQVGLYVSTAAVAPTAGQCFVGVYSASSGQLLGTSADIGASLTSTGAKTLSLAASTASQNAGVEVLVALLFNGTTGPVLRSTGTAVVGNYNITAAGHQLWATYGTAQTVLPATITVASISTYAGSPWFALL